MRFFPTANLGLSTVTSVFEWFDNGRQWEVATWPPKPEILIFLEQQVCQLLFAVAMFLFMWLVSLWCCFFS